MTDANKVTAEVKQIPSNSYGGAFQTLDVLIPHDRHWQINGLRDGAHVVIYCPTDDELRAIVYAARGEIRRRHELAHPRPCADCDEDPDRPYADIKGYSGLSLDQRMEFNTLSPHIDDRAGVDCGALCAKCNYLRAASAGFNPCGTCGTRHEATAKPCADCDSGAEDIPPHDCTRYAKEAAR